jgi:putative transcriptional regulator
MKKELFNDLKAGLEEAIAHASGGRTAGRLRRVYIPSIDVTKLRERLGLSQEDFADAFGVSVGTVRGWEQGRREPDGPARVLLTVIDREPAAVLRALDVPRREPKTASRPRTATARRKAG